MDQSKITKQMIDFQKATFDNSFTAMILVQEQTEKMVNMFLEQATWVPNQGRKALNEWVQTLKKGRDEYKKTVDESFKKVEDFFAASAKGKTE